MAKRKKKRRLPRTSSAAILRRRLLSTERRLRQVEQRYEIAMGAINESVYDWDIAAGRIFYSESMERAIGLAPGVLKTTQDWWDRIHPEDLARYRAAFIAHFKGDTARFECEYRYRGADGSWRWCRQHGLALRDAKGRAVRMVGSTGDITRLKEREEELVAQKALTRSLIDENPSAMYLKDKLGRYVTVNDAWLKMVGVTRERAIGRNVLELFPETESERYHAEDMRLIAQGEGSSEVESLRTGPDGKPQWVIIRKAVLRRDDGEVIGLIGANTDITRLKQYEAQLADSNKFIAELIDALPVSIALRDTKHRFLQVNRTWERFFGLRREEVLGKRFAELPGWRDNPELLEVAREGEKIDREIIAGGTGKEPVALQHKRLGRSYLISRQVFADSTGRLTAVLATGLDTTESTAMEEAIKRAEREAADRAKFVSELIDALPISVAMRDLEGRYALVNRMWESYFGVKREDAIGRRRRELPGWQADPAHRQDASDVEQVDREFLARGPDFIPEAEEVHRLGRHYLMTRRVLADSGGTPLGVLSAGMDTTERHAMEEALKRAERDAADRAKFIGELVDGLPISVAMRDLEGRYVLVNRTWERYFGIRREDVLGKRRRELPGADGDPLRAEDAARIEAADRELLARPDYVPEPRELLRLGRSYLISSRALADSAGKLTGILSAGVDTTERRATEQALVTEQRRLDMVVAAARVGIVDWDGHTHATYYSPRFREMLGHPPDADTSSWPDYFKVLIHPDDRERITQRWRTFILGKGPGTPREEYYSPEEYRLLRADGNFIWVQASGMAMRDEKGFTTRWIAAITEITERRAQEEALRASVRLREEVERMSRHDLKTPLNSVIAMSRLLREGGRVAREDAELLGTIERAGYRILNMVNLSLDLFRMETGTYQFHPQAVDLAGVACRVAADLEGQAASKNLDVRVRANGVSAATQEVMARGDELLCYSMFANLVKNAIEAAPAGSTVSISLTKEDDAVIAKVHNPGAVPEGMRGRFFRKYATTGKSAGLGLGTYSAQLMARVQEGELTLESSEAAGTTLIARLKPAGTDLPRAVESRAAAIASVAAGEALPPSKVLVVDDDEFNRLVLRRYLPSPPLSVAFAVNGRAALEAAGQDWPDVVLLDLEMPVMDGYEAAHRLREMERTRNLKRCLIVAISSNDEEPVVQRALAAGCDQYVVKPAPRQVLWRILGGAAGDEAAGAAPAAANAADAVIVDEDLRAKLPEFLRSRRELLDQMPGALTAGDRAHFKRSAHRLAGSFALFGFAWAAAQCRGIENDALDGFPNDLETRVAAVRAHLDDVTIEFAPAKGAISAE